jgi:FkbM family methyltransferase
MTSNPLTKLMRPALEYVLRKRGYELKQLGMPPRGFANFLAYVEVSGLRPKTVFDVGVGYGTPWLYEHFAHAKFVLIEALPTFRPQVEAVAAKLRADYHMVGLGREQGIRRIRIPRTGPTGASLLQRSPELRHLQEDRGQTIEDEYADVQITRFDQLASYEPPFFVKMDVEGAELDVLLGATETLKKTEIVLMELSVLPRYEGEASFADMVQFMDRANFRVFDIVEMAQEGPDGPLIYLDIAFARKDLAALKR